MPSPDRVPCAISATRLEKTFGSFAAVRGLDLEIRVGECFGILGPNGAGKTTTLNMLLGRSLPSGGELRVFGESPAQLGGSVRERIGVVPQIDNLDPDFTVIENLRVYGSFFGLPRAVLDERIPALLDFVELGHRASSRVGALSGGMQRRLTLARALINDPELLFLDEPTTGLDPQVRHLMWSRLRELIQSGKTLVLTTHYMEEAERLCDRILIIDQGQRVELDSPRELVARNVEREVLEVAHSNDAGHSVWAQRLGGFGRVEEVGQATRLYGERLEPVIAELGDLLGRQFLHRPANLEDVFLRLTGRGLRGG